MLPPLLLETVLAHLARVFLLYFSDRVLLYAFQYQCTAASCSQGLCPLLQNDAAVYISAVLQHTVERLVAGALSSCDKADFRSEASTHMDVKPRHLQVGSV